MLKTAKKVREIKQSDLIIGSRIRRLRQDANWTQEELRLKLKLKSNGYLSQVERGLCCMSRKNINKAANLFNVDPAVLVSQDEYSEEDFNDIVDFMRMVRDGLGKENRSAIRSLIKSAKK